MSLCAQPTMKTERRSARHAGLPSAEIGAKPPGAAAESIDLEDLGSDRGTYVELDSASSFNPLPSTYHL